jgi:hypothetical protein
VDNGIKGLIMAGSEDEIFRRIGKTLPDNVCDWTSSGWAHMNGAWRNLDELFDGLSTKAAWRHRSFGPGTIMETPGHVGDALVDGLYLVGERTREAKVMGVYGSAQTALAAADRILAV